MLTVLERLPVPRFKPGILLASFGVPVEIFYLPGLDPSAFAGGELS